MFVGWALGLACFLYLLALPPTLHPADESYFLYGAKRVLQGQALYRDFWEFLTPGTFYIYALAYAVGGVSITSARVATALFSAVSVTCAYLLALRVASTAEALLAGLLVVVICIPVWNQAGHHWIATALGLATAAVVTAPRWANSTRARPAAAGALAGLLVCTHQNRGLWLVLWLAITIPALALARTESGRWQRTLRELVWTAAGGAAVCAPVLGYAVWRSSVSDLIYATYTWVLANYRSYNVGRVTWNRTGLAMQHARYTYPRLLELIPLILGVEVASLLWAVWRRGWRSQVVRAVLLGLALTAVAAISYYPDVIHVAFVTPFALVVMAGMIYRTRTTFAFMETPPAMRLARLVWVGLLAIVLVKAWGNARRAWNENSTLFETAFGTIAGGEGQRALLRDLRERLPVEGGASPKLFAYHNDAWLYLTLPADNPTPFALLRPVYNTAAQIQQAIDRLECEPQARVVLTLLALAQPNDPFVQYVKEHFRRMTGVGPTASSGIAAYFLFERVPLK